MILDAQEKLRGAFEYLSNILSTGESSLVNGAIKFSETVQKLPVSRLPSAFHEFGNDIADGVKRKSRSKMFVQPGSASRRKGNNRSRQPQPAGKKLNLKKLTNKARRPHKLSTNVKQIVNNPNKSKYIMSSRTKTFLPKKCQQNISVKESKK